MFDRVGVFFRQTYASRPRVVEWSIVLLFALLICLSSVPAPFIIDEDNYLVTVLAARNGGLAVPGTEGLPATRELLYFCPSAISREVSSTPVFSVVPPLYAFIALPFSLAGWYGLVFLNSLAFCSTGYLLLNYLRRKTEERWVPWVGVAALTLGSTCLEYAQGIWPHSLSVFLVFAAYLAMLKGAGLSSRVGLKWVFLAGLLIALATGVRYQNIVWLLGIGSCLFIFTREGRWSKSMAYLGGCSIPLGVSSLVNFSRFDSFNPISKGGNYLRSSVLQGVSNDGFHSVADFFAISWARLVDFRSRPMFPSWVMDSYVQRDPETKAYLFGMTAKKALMQSSPWVILSFFVLLLVWVRRKKSPGSVSDLRGMGLCTLGLIAAFGLAGSNRHDGLCYNQRYFLELAPFLAAALACGLSGVSLNWRMMLLGGIGILIPLILWNPYSAEYPGIFMVAPLVMAALLMIAWLLPRSKAGVTMVALILGASMGWAFSVQLVDEIPSSRVIRNHNKFVGDVVGPVIEGPSAIFAWYGNKDAFGALQIDHDLVVLDPHADKGESADALAGALLDQKRRVYVYLPGMPPKILLEITRERELRLILEDGEGRPFLVEVLDEEP